jgi:hypothetical protein
LKTIITDKQPIKTLIGLVHHGKFVAIKPKTNETWHSKQKKKSVQPIISIYQQKSKLIFLARNITNKKAAKTTSNTKLIIAIMLMFSTTNLICLSIATINYSAFIFFCFLMDKSIYFYKI